MEGSDREELNKKRIEDHLKSAVTGLMPNVIDRVDLSVPQEETGAPPYHAGYRRKRIYAAGTLIAACLCLVLLAGGMYNYRNSRVDSIIGIDVNPSVELSVNRKNKVLKARALNEDAVDILSGMTLKGVDLNVAVNAVIGSMVQHGYLDDVENAILVTVSNDSVSKSAGLRAAVVEDIQASLVENQVEAVVYDQQAVELDEIKQLADEYGISYGKAYFLQELISQDPGLAQEDMESLAPLTMEEIARKMTGGASSTDKELGADKESESSSEESKTEAVTEVSEEESSEEEISSGQISGTSQEPQRPPETAETPEASTEEVVTEGKIKVDYTDYEEGILTVNFSVKVKWKKPTVSVTDREGNTYAASFEKTTSTSCEVRVDGLKGGHTYQFVLGGISPKIGKATTVSGTFETPVIGDNFEDDGDDDADETSAEESSTAPSTEEETTSAPVETTEKSQSEAASEAETDAQPAAESDGETENTQETGTPAQES